MTKQATREYKNLLKSCNKDAGALASDLRELATEQAPELETSFYSDIMMASVREVDYYEVAKSLLED
jgi:hypothetical protein